MDFLELFQNIVPFVFGLAMFVVIFVFVYLYKESVKKQLQFWQSLGFTIDNSKKNTNSWLGGFRELYLIGVHKGIRMEVKLMNNNNHSYSSVCVPFDGQFNDYLMIISKKGAAKIVGKLFSNDVEFKESRLNDMFTVNIENNQDRVKIGELFDDPNFIYKLEALCKIDALGGEGWISDEGVNYKWFGVLTGYNSVKEGLQKVVEVAKLMK